MGKNLKITFAWRVRTTHVRAASLNTNLLDWKTEGFIELDAITWFGKDIVFTLEVLLPRIMAEGTRVGMIHYTSVCGGISLVVGAKVT